MCAANEEMAVPSPDLKSSVEGSGANFPELKIKKKPFINVDPSFSRFRGAAFGVTVHPEVPATRVPEKKASPIQRF